MFWTTFGAETDSHFFKYNAMHHLSILVPDGDINLSSVIGSYKIFKGANRYLQSLGKSDIFDIQLVGLTGHSDLYEGRFSIRPDVRIRDVQKTNLIIVPAISHDFSTVIAQNRELSKWLLLQYQKGAEIATLCTGAFLLAPTGLLDERKWSTHGGAAHEFRKLFPRVRLATDQLITDEQGIYTNGGAFSFLNLLLYLVEKYYGRETAIYCSKVFQVDIERNSQSPFAIFAGQKGHEDAVIKKAQALMEKNPMENFSVDTLADMFALSRRNFDRRFLKATGNTPSEYLRRVKIEAAKRSLETGDKQISRSCMPLATSMKKPFAIRLKK